MIAIILCIFLMFLAFVGNFGRALCYTLFFVPAAIIAITVHAIEPNFWPFIGAAFALAAMGYAGLLLYITLFPPKKRENRHDRKRKLRNA